MKLDSFLHVEIDKLMVYSLAAMVDKISNRNEAGLTEIIAKTSVHDSSIAKMKSLSQNIFLYIFELLSLL